MEITYDYYRIFYYVAKYKSFSKAANVLGSNQPNITKFMNNLESQLRCKLFVRSNRGTVLTPEGEKLYTHVAVAYEHLRKAELELTDDKSLQSGVVTIGSCESALHGILLPVLENFHARYPGIRLCISNISTSQALQLLRNGVSDFAVVTTPTNILPHFNETTLSTFHDLLIGSRQYRFLCKTPLHYVDILSYPMIGLGKGTMTYEFYTQLFLKNGLVWKLDTEVGTTNQLLPMIECNLGIGFLADFLARNAIETGRVFQIPLCMEMPEREILLVEDKTRRLSIAANRFKKMLIDYSNGLCR
ncbi:LysR family transcriptional regulator [Dysosmobacter sp. NSJ-60]|uniref:LysR family transcriptional regulator n=1 Tax=Pusillibacter faecalis TaxID=2714358 RepID=A0A810QBM4_9FIRM|nr:LysR family transcriptional regulator [Pusillibacter faecalis]MBC5746952.1 LysR family transcriptional regulator [Dysosmobacter hominis]MBS5659010.1 LysR family transcriptional regulator [Oscillibacter sp.]BCK85678.1 LysR family transcriptional regulator [Pusillibacter faecalis]